MISKSSISSVALAGAFALVLGGLPALAAQDGSGGGNAKPCDAGYTRNKDGKCEKTSYLNDRELYEQGRALALAGYYENALEALMAVKNKEHAGVLTYIGYAQRKMGNVEDGIAWYHKALAIDPDNLNTREYLGEGYIAAGREDLAKLELVKLETLCGNQTCEQYQALSAAIAGEPESWGGL